MAVPPSGDADRVSVRHYFVRTEKHSIDKRVANSGIGGSPTGSTQVRDRSAALLRCGWLCVADPLGHSDPKQAWRRPSRKTRSPTLPVPGMAWS